MDGSSSELVTNGNFSSSANWTCGGGWVISGGTANISDYGSDSSLTQSISLVEGETYSIEYSVVSSSANSGILKLYDGSNAPFGSQALDSTVDTHKYYLECVNAADDLCFQIMDWDGNTV